jgi:hypothetical protein
VPPVAQKGSTDGTPCVMDGTGNSILNSILNGDIYNQLGDRHGYARARPVDQSCCEAGGGAGVRYGARCAYQAVINRAHERGERQYRATPSNST